MDLAKAVADVVGQTKDSQGISFHISVAPDPFIIEADPNQLRQVIANVFSNAVDSMQGQGDFLVEAMRDGDYDTIRFRDTGAGFAPCVLDRLFEPLVTTKAKGIGLGLTICRQSIESHGGTISAANQQEGGAVITVNLPHQ